MYALSLKVDLTLRKKNMFLLSEVLYKITNSLWSKL